MSKHLEEQYAQLFSSVVAIINISCCSLPTTGEQCSNCGDVFTCVADHKNHDMVCHGKHLFKNRRSELRLSRLLNEESPLPSGGRIYDVNKKRKHSEIATTSEPRPQKHQVLHYPTESRNGGASVTPLLPSIQTKDEFGACSPSTLPNASPELSTPGPHGPRLASMPQPSFFGENSPSNVYMSMSWDCGDYDPSVVPIPEAGCPSYVDVSLSSH